MHPHPNQLFLDTAQKTQTQFIIVGGERAHTPKQQNNAVPPPTSKRSTNEDRTKQQTPDSLNHLD